MRQGLDPTDLNTRLRSWLCTRTGTEIMAALRNLTTRPHPPGPRHPSRYCLHHQIPVTTTKTRHQAHHPTNHQPRPCRPLTSLLGLGFWLREFPFQTVLGSLDDLYAADVEGTSDLGEGFEADEASSVEEEEERGLERLTRLVSVSKVIPLEVRSALSSAATAPLSPMAGSLAMLAMISVLYI